MKNIILAMALIGMTASAFAQGPSTYACYIDGSRWGGTWYDFGSCQSACTGEAIRRLQIDGRSRSARCRALLN